MAEEIITSTNAETATDHEYNASEIQVLKGLEQTAKVGAPPDVRHQNHPVIFPRPGHAQLGKFGDEGGGQVVHRKSPYPP